MRPRPTCACPARDRGRRAGRRGFSRHRGDPHDAGQHKAGCDGCTYRSRHLGSRQRGIGRLRREHAGERCRRRRPGPRRSRGRSLWIRRLPRARRGRRATGDDGNASQCRAHLRSTISSQPRADSSRSPRRRRTTRRERPRCTPTTARTGASSGTAAPLGITALAGGAQGLVAVGSEVSGGSTRTAIWYSRDGRVWQQAAGDATTYPQGAALDVSAGPGGFVAIGEEFGSVSGRRPRDCAPLDVERRRALDARRGTRSAPTPPVKQSSRPQPASLLAAPTQAADGACRRRRSSCRTPSPAVVAWPRCMRRSVAMRRHGRRPTGATGSSAHRNRARSTAWTHSCLRTAGC